MNNYAFLIKAKAKSGAKNLFCWFSAKSDSRAQREIENILEDAEIETGRGADYQLPARTSWLIVDDMPAEGVLDDTWCDRYELGEDGISWSLIAKTAESVSIHEDHAQVVAAPPAAAPENLRPVARLRLPQRLIAHLLNDAEEKEISEAQHVQIGERELDENNTYVRTLLLSIKDAPGIDELSAHVEWKLIQAVKELFPQDQTHDVSAMSGFIAAWIEAEPGERTQLVSEWADIVRDWPEINTQETVSQVVQEFRNADMPELITVATLPFRQRLLAQFIAEKEYAYNITAEQKKEVISLEMDVDNSYVQNLLLAAENTPSLKDVREYDLWKLTDAVKQVFPQDKKTPELALMLQLLKVWSETRYVDRALLVKEWVKGNRVSAIQRTDTGTNAGGGITTDRNPDYEHTLDTLDTEIAAATLPMDFDIYAIPESIRRRTEEIIKKKESPFKEWSSVLRKTPGILDFSRAAIFALIRGAAENVHHFPASLQTYISANLTEHQHDKPRNPAPARTWEDDSKMLAAARGEYVEGISDPTDPKWDKTPRKTFCTHEENLQRVREEGARRRLEEAESQPKVENLGAGLFSIEGLTSSTPLTPDNGPVMGDVTYQEMAEGLREELEIIEDVQMETAVSDEIPVSAEISAGESVDADNPEADAVNAADAFSAGCPGLAAAAVQQTEPQNIHEVIPATEEVPAVEHPAYFEPGRYEGLPNNVYHAANGISSTMIKDARVSLMFYHARHVIKTIRRESSEALTFGSLTHTLILEPEKLYEEFAVFPGVPEEAFTTTDSMKAFIREFNADKPKTEQLKLTGKKEELQAAIRAVNPGAIFADEFEQQWRDSVAGKTILTSEQLELAVAIQQALYNNSDAYELLGNPERKSEVSYFGIDEETGLEIRVRPDIELRTPTENICADLKTVSIGNVRQDRIKERLHREIIDRDYHLSAAMYCDVAGLDNFSWIFVNKEPGYHWVAVVQASEEELELGRQEYRRVLRQIYESMESDVWPAPIVGTYTDELNDYDLRRLQALVEE